MGARCSGNVSNSPMSACAGSTGSAPSSVQVARNQGRFQWMTTVWASGVSTRSSMSRRASAFTVVSVARAGSPSTTVTS